jgi:hypothetical protein
MIVTPAIQANTLPDIAPVFWGYTTWTALCCIGSIYSTYKSIRIYL